MTRGLKHDKGKLQWHLLPMTPIRLIVRVLQYGAEKYGENNWMQLENATIRYYDALMRHIAAWREGEWLDRESKLPHLAHAGCCVIFLLWHGLMNRR